MLELCMKFVHETHGIVTDRDPSEGDTGSGTDAVDRGDVGGTPELGNVDGSPGGRQRQRD